MIYARSIQIVTTIWYNARATIINYPIFPVMKRLFTVIVLVTITFMAGAQTQARIADSVYQNNILYGISAPLSRVGIFINIDKTTRWIEPHNQTPNSPLTNYVFLEGAKRIRAQISIPTDSIGFYHYNILENNARWLVRNGSLLPLIKTEDNTSTVTFNLGEFDISGRDLTIEVYKDDTIRNLTQVHICNSTIKPASLFLTTLALTDKNGNRMAGTKTEKDGFTFKLNGKYPVNALLVAIYPTRHTQLYHIVLKNVRTGTIVNIGNNWRYGFLDKYPYQYIDVPFFNAAGDYILSVEPRLATEQLKPRTFPSLSTSIRFSVLGSTEHITKKYIYVAAIFIVLIIASATLYYFNLRKQKKQVTKTGNDDLKV